MGRKWFILLGLAALAGCATSTTTVQTPGTVTQPPRAVVAAPPTAAPTWPAEAPPIYARSAIMIDARTGRTLYQKNADQMQQVASTQKLVTALVLVDGGGLTGTTTVAKADTAVEPSKLGLRAGETYSRLNLLTAMLVKSENDVAAALARDYAGSISNFAGLMNQKAREVGANDSYFVNPHGLPAPQHSTARDMAKVAFKAYHEPVIRRIVDTQYYPFTFASGRQVTLENTNKLLGRSMICNGMKTGYTDAAGKCLISSATMGGRDVILVQLGSRSSHVFEDAERMMQWGLGGASGAAFTSPYLTQY